MPPVLPVAAAARVAARHRGGHCEGGVQDGGEQHRRLRLLAPRARVVAAGIAGAGEGGHLHGATRRVELDSAYRVIACVGAVLGFVLVAGVVSVLSVVSVLQLCDEVGVVGETVLLVVVIVVIILFEETDCDFSDFSDLIRPVLNVEGVEEEEGALV